MLAAVAHLSDVMTAVTSYKLSERLDADGVERTAFYRVTHFVIRSSFKLPLSIKELCLSTRDR